MKVSIETYTPNWETILQQIKWLSPIVEFQGTNYNNYTPHKVNVYCHSPIILSTITHTSTHLSTLRWLPDVIIYIYECIPHIDNIDIHSKYEMFINEHNLNLPIIRINHDNNTLTCIQSIINSYKLT